MPGGNGTGPMGLGPMTGRGAGFCAGMGVPGFANHGYGRGFGAGFSRGGSRGYRNRFHATGLTGWQRSGMGYPPYTMPAAPVYTPAYPLSVTNEQQLATLKEQAAYLGNILEGIRKRIEEIEAAK